MMMYPSTNISSGDIPNSMRCSFQCSHHFAALAEPRGTLVEHNIAVSIAPFAVELTNATTALNNSLFNSLLNKLRCCWCLAKGGHQVVVGVYIQIYIYIYIYMSQAVDRPPPFPPQPPAPPCGGWGGGGVWVVGWVVGGFVWGWFRVGIGLV